MGVNGRERASVSDGPHAHVLVRLRQESVRFPASAVSPPALSQLQLGTDAGKEFGLVVRLRHVVVAPKREPLDNVCG